MRIDSWFYAAVIGGGMMSIALIIALLFMG